MVASALHGWNMSLVVTLDKCMTSFGYPNLLTNSTKGLGVGGEEKAKRGARVGTGSEEFCLLSYVNIDLENRTAYEIFIHSMQLLFPIGTHRLCGTICSSVRTGDAIAGACSALAIDSTKLQS
ncbi:hypothetical protein Tco_1343872 [Tanacetum coccineum]